MSLTISVGIRRSRPRYGYRNDFELPGCPIGRLWLTTEAPCAIDLEVRLCNKSIKI
jgi:hypothetical protein